MTTWDIPKNDQFEILGNLFDILISGGDVYDGFMIEDTKTTRGIYNKDFSQKKYTPQLTYLINDAKTRLKQCNLLVNEFRGSIEFHKYNVKGERKAVFDDHTDDFGGVNYKVETVIYYFRKDNIEGGDLLVDDTLIDVKPKEGQIKAVGFSGNVTHKVTDMFGNGGIRECIVVQLYSMRND